MATDPESIDVTPTWLGILPALIAIIENGSTVESHKTAEAELRRMAGLADAHVATIRALHAPAKRLRDALNSGGLGELGVVSPDAVRELVAAARDMATRL